MVANVRQMVFLSAFVESVVESVKRNWICVPRYAILLFIKINESF